MKWYLKVLKNYAVFTGRARRREYWFFILFNIIIMLGLGFFEGALGIFSDSKESVLSGLYTLAVILPSLAVGARRLHDIGRPASWLFLMFLPFIGPLVLLIFFVQDSQPGENLYGFNPKETPVWQGMPGIES